MKSPGQCMKRLPLLVDERSSALARAATLLLVPIVIVLALPLIFLLILVLYVAAVLHGAKVCVHVFTGKPEPSESDMSRPHFLDLPAKQLPDESAPPAKG